MINVYFYSFYSNFLYFGQFMYKFCVQPFWYLYHKTSYRGLHISYSQPSNRLQSSVSIYVNEDTRILIYIDIPFNFFFQCDSFHFLLVELLLDRFFLPSIPVWKKRPKNIHFYPYATIIIYSFIFMKSPSTIESLLFLYSKTK